MVIKARQEYVRAKKFLPEEKPAKIRSRVVSEPATTGNRMNEVLPGNPTPGNTAIPTPVQKGTSKK